MRRIRPRARIVIFPVVSLGAGCAFPDPDGPVRAENSALRTQVDSIRRTLDRCEEDRRDLRGQVHTLQRFSRERPADLFAPESIAIVSRSGGADYDGKPGDDGITVYLRPLDGEGDPVKVPGDMVIEVLDLSDTGSPSVVGVYRFEGAAAIGDLWYSRFGTNHFALRCPFPDGFVPPQSGRLTVHARFTDYLAGKTLRAVREVSFHVSDAD